MAVNKKRGPKKGAKYEKDPKKKLDAGLDWSIKFKADPEVGHKILEKMDDHPKGTEYGFEINRALKKAYGIKSK